MRSPPLALALAALTVASAARADPPPVAPLEVEVIGARPDALAGIPGSATVVTEQELRRARPADAAEMLRRVPGMVVRQDAGAGLRLDLGARGLDGTRGRRLLVLEDGVPLAVNPYAEPDLYFGPVIERARSIEVVKGSGSILFGPQTIGGVVDFLTVAPPDRRLALLEVTGGSDAYARYLARYGDAVGSVRYVVQALHKQGRSFRGDDSRADDVLAKASFASSRAGRVTLKLGFHDERAHSTEVGLTQAIFEADPRRPSLAPSDELGVRRLEVAVLHEVGVTSEVSLRTLAYAYTTSRVWRKQDYDRAPAPGRLYARIVGDPAVAGGALYFRDTTTVPDRSYDVAGLEPRVDWRPTTGSVRHEVQAGARLLVERGHRQERAGQAPTSSAGDLTLDESHRSLALAAYAQDRLRFRDDLSVYPGVRIEHVAYSRAVARAVVAGAPEDVSVAGQSSATAVLPGLGITAGSAKNHLFGGLHVGFAPPRVTTAIAATGQDQRLAAERSINYEVGARLAPRPWLELEATGFVDDFSNQILPAGPVPRGQPELVNAGATRHLGVESAAVLRSGAALDLGFGVDLALRYTLARATFSGGVWDQRLLPYAPLHTASATLDVEHPVGLGAEVAWAFVSEQFANPLNTVRADATGRVGRLAPYHIVDLGARYRERRTRLTVSVTAKNALDSTYIASRRPDGIFLGAPRVMMVGLGWDHE